MVNHVNRTQMTRALLALREQILSGEFRPGERMSELPLVERLGVSRTPLRLALAALEHEGLLRVLPAGGYAVREFTLGDVRDAIELRGVLEGTACRFAAERGATRRELRTLRAINDSVEPLVHRADYESFERYVALNEDFHARLLKLARSPLLERTLDAVASLPFASPSALVLHRRPAARVARDPDRRPPATPVARRGDRRREGARADNVAREHARLSLTNLEIVLGHRGLLEQMPGASLIALHDDGELQPADGALRRRDRPSSHGSASYSPHSSATRTAASISRAPGRYASSSGGLTGTGVYGAPTR